MNRVRTARSGSRMSQPPHLFQPDLNKTIKTKIKEAKVPFPVKDVKDLTNLVNKLTSEYEHLEKQSDFLNEKIECLQQEIESSGSTIEKLQNQLTTSNINTSKSITAETAELFLRDNPIILKVFLDHLEGSDLSHIISSSDPEVLPKILTISLEQLNRAKICFEKVKNIRRHLHTQEFYTEVKKCLMELLHTKEVFIFIRDMNTSLFFSNLRNSEIQVRLKSQDALVLKCVGQESPIIIENPLTDPKHSQSLDPLFNPNNLPMMLIPVNSNCTLVAIHTDIHSISFTKEDSSVSEYFGRLISPLMEEQSIYQFVQENTERQNTKRKIEDSLLRVHSFSSLIKFFSQSPLSDAVIYISDDEEAYYYTLDNTQLVEHRVKKEGLLQKAFESGEDDGIYFPLKDRFNVITSVLKTENTNGVDMVTFCAALALVVPQCIKNARNVILQRSSVASNILKQELEKLTYEVLESDSAIHKISSAIASVADCQYVLIKGPSNTICYENGHEVDPPIDPEKLTKTIITADPSKEGFDNIHSLLCVSGPMFITACINSKCKVAAFDDTVLKCIAAISSYLDLHECFNQLHAKEEKADFDNRYMTDMFSIIKISSKSERPLRAALEEMTKCIEMERFAIFVNNKLIEVSEGFDIEKADDKEITESSFSGSLLQDMSEILLMNEANFVVVFAGNKVAVHAKDLMDLIVAHFAMIVRNTTFVPIKETFTCEAKEVKLDLNFCDFTKESAFKIIKSYGFDIPDDIIKHILMDIEEAHSDIPFHNFRRAIDTMSFMSYLIEKSDLKSKLKNTEILASLLAAIGRTVHYGMPAPSCLYESPAEMRAAHLIDIISKYRIDVDFELLKKIAIAGTMESFTDVVATLKADSECNSNVLCFFILISSFAGLVRPGKFAEYASEHEKESIAFGEHKVANEWAMSVVDEFARSAVSLSSEIFPSLSDLEISLEQNIKLFNQSV